MTGGLVKKPVLLLRDLLQLSPVNGDPPFVNLTNKQIDKFVGCCGNFPLWNLFEYDELTLNMRQQGDEIYGRILKRMRVGLMCEEDHKILESRKIALVENTVDGRLNEICNLLSNLPAETVCLLPKRNMCRQLNDQMLARLPSEEIRLRAIDSFACPAYVRKKILKELETNDEHCSKSGGIPQEITVKVGAKIMLTRNIEVSKGLINGTIGVIKSVTKTLENDIKTLNVLLPSGAEHAIERIGVKFEVMERAFVIRNQFPVCLSYAITVHKSQGLSLAKALIDAGNNIFAEGRIYVALSRLTSLNGLLLINFDPTAVKANSQAVSEYNRLRAQYRPDLAQLPILTSRKSRKTDDKVWVVPKHVLACQTSVDSDVLLCNVIPLQRVDEASYATALLQCVFHCEDLKRELYKLPTNRVLRKTFEVYIRPNALPTASYFPSIKQFVDPKYSENTEQDVGEFAKDLFAKVDGLKSMIRHNIKFNIVCKNTHCKYTEEVERSEIILVLKALRWGSTSATSLNQLLIDRNVSGKTLKFTSCKMCRCVKALESYEILSVGQILLVRPFDGNVRIKGIHNKIHKIKGDCFKLACAIFKTENKPPRNIGTHYTTMLRGNESSASNSTWYCVDNSTVRRQRWPALSKGACLFFFQKLKPST